MEKIKTPIFLIGLAFLAFFVSLAWKEIFDSQTLQLSFFNVEQGDAIFIETPQGHQMLIDGGPDDKILEKISRKMPLWDHEIDLVILSHPAQDHLAGLIEVLKKYKVKNILWTGVKKDTKIFQRWMEAIFKEKEEGANVFVAKAGQRIKWSKGVIRETKSHKNCPQYLDVLYPFEDLSGQVVGDDNDTSIVLKLSFCPNTALFTGDITKKTEMRLLEEKSDLDSDILKVAHHGSKTSSSDEFLGKVSPEIAVIQVGKNNQYGHPDKEVLERLQNYGIKVFRTDRDGDIVFKFPIKR